MRLGRRAARGGEERAGRVVNGTTAQVVPRGTIRAVLRRRRRDMEGGHVSASMAEELARRGEAPREMIPGMPDSWGLEAGRRQLADLIARARGR